MFEWLKNKKNNTLPIINASKDMEIAYKEAVNNSKIFINYEEILNINESDRLSLLKFIWSKWDSRSEYILRDLINKYPQYSITDLKFIAHFENLRINNYYKKNKWKEAGSILAKYYSNQNYDLKNIHLCYLDDMPYVLKEWHTDNGFTDWFSFQPISKNILQIANDINGVTLDKNIEKIYYWSCGKELEFDKEMFKSFMAQSNIQIEYN